MNPNDVGAVRERLDRLARAGELHLKNCRVAAGERTRAAALALYDRQLGLHDRLLTADEFLQDGSAGAFEAAAMEDAARFFESAESAALARIETPGAPVRSGSRWIYAGAAAVVAIALLVLWLMRGVEESGIPSPALANSDAVLNRADVPMRDPSVRRDSQRASRSSRSASDRATGAQADRSADRTVLADAQGDATNAGAPTRAKPSQASSGTSGGSSDGAAPDEEGSSEQPAADAPARAGGDSPGGQNDALAAQRERARDPSGTNAPEATAGTLPTAAANGGNRQGASRSGSNAQGGQQESRQNPRRPTGAQGRTGQNGPPGESTNPGTGNNTSQGKGQGARNDALKKSRGVASMILGVPVPDEVRGLPNPGLVRTLQKKTAPQAQAVAAVDAQDRSARSSALGNVEHPSLQPWMKDLVRDYFSQDSSPEGQP